MRLVEFTLFWRVDERKRLRTSVEARRWLRTDSSGWFSKPLVRMSSKDQSGVQARSVWNSGFMETYTVLASGHLIWLAQVLR
jgi:hypothetical protein